MPNINITRDEYAEASGERSIKDQMEDYEQDESVILTGNANILQIPRNITRVEFLKQLVYDIDWIDIDTRKNYEWNTFDQHRKNHEYYNYRKLIHSEIFDQLFQHAVMDPTPTIIILGGPIGAGKTTTINYVKRTNTIEDINSSTVVDMDEIKQLLPEYPFFRKQNRKTWAIRLHNESGSIADFILERSAKSNYSLIMDGTMAGLTFIKNTIKLFRAHGYKIIILYVDILLKTAIKRMKQRYKRTGRFISPDIIKNKYILSYRTLRSVRKLVDRTIVYNNEGEQPVLVVEYKKNVIDQIYNHQLFNEFQGRLQKRRR